MLYAFCRVADDLIDDTTTSPDVGLATLHTRLSAIYASTPADDPIDRALSVVVRRSRLPRPLLDAMLEGFAWDASGRRYATLGQVHEYAARVAGTVGAMMSILMGRNDPSAVARACDLAVAMQLTNIARDVGEDAARGRVYLPLDWLEGAGVHVDAWLESPRADARIAEVVARLLRAADTLYERADSGVAMLPADCRFAIRAARLLYSDIGSQIARTGFDPVSRRAYVPTLRKVWLLFSLVRRARPTGRPDDGTAPPLPATRYLVTACQGVR